MQKSLFVTIDGNTETATKDNLTYNEFDALITALSHKHLAPAEKKPEKLMADYLASKGVITKNQAKEFDIYRDFDHIDELIENIME